jgi:hypothetical protein
VHLAQKDRFLVFGLAPMPPEIARELGRALVAGADKVDQTTPKRRKPK